MGGMTPPASDGAPTGPPLPKIDGSFSIVTDGAILANNTDEGPVAAEKGRALSWTINARTSAAPMALIQID